MLAAPGSLESDIDISGASVTDEAEVSGLGYGSTGVDGVTAAGTSAGSSVFEVESVVVLVSSVFGFSVSVVLAVSASLTTSFLISASGIIGLD